MKCVNGWTKVNEYIRMRLSSFFLLSNKGRHKAWLAHSPNIYWKVCSLSSYSPKPRTFQLCSTFPHWLPLSYCFWGSCHEPATNPSVPLLFLCHLNISPLDYGSSLLNLPCILPPIVSPLSIPHMAAQVIFLKHMLFPCSKSSKPDSKSVI